MAKSVLELHNLFGVRRLADRQLVFGVLNCLDLSQRLRLMYVSTTWNGLVKDHHRVCRPDADSMEKVLARYQLEREAVTRVWEKPTRPDVAALSFKRGRLAFLSDNHLNTYNVHSGTEWRSSELTFRPSRTSVSESCVVAYNDGQMLICWEDYTKPSLNAGFMISTALLKGPVGTSLVANNLLVFNADHQECLLYSYLFASLELKIKKLCEVAGVIKQEPGKLSRPMLQSNCESILVFEIRSRYVPLPLEDDVHFTYTGQYVRFDMNGKRMEVAQTRSPLISKSNVDFLFNEESDTVNEDALQVIFHRKFKSGDVLNLEALCFNVRCVRLEWVQTTMGMVNVYSPLYMFAAITKYDRAAAILDSGHVAVQFKSNHQSFFDT